MNKFVVFTVIALFLIVLVSFAMAAENKDNMQDRVIQKTNLGNDPVPNTIGRDNKMHNGTESADNETQKDQPDRGIGQILSKEIKERRQEFKEGNFTGPMGRFLQVKELSEDLREFRTGDVSAETDLNITVILNENNSARLNVHFKNGKDKEIKIMPETASEKAIERLGLKVCNLTNNCTIVLKEVGEGNDTNARYDLQVDRHYKILGLFEAKAENKAEIDADNANVVSTERPWWSFLAKAED